MFDHRGLRAFPCRRRIHQERADGSAIVGASYTDTAAGSAGTSALSRPFLTTIYRPDETGRLRPILPDRCPLAEEEPDGRTCSIRVSFFRRRKTGPALPLAVCRCATHVRAFTAYPPGFAPYLRQPLLAIPPIGEDADPRGLPSFEGTVFDAAVAASAGDAWARSSDASAGDVPDRWWSTQLRRIAAALRVLGLAPELADDLRARIAHLLDVPVTRLAALSRRLTGYRSRGKAITTVLRRLSRARRTSRLLLDLLTCCWLTGRLGRPLWWIAGRGFHPLAFSTPAMPSGP